MLAICAPSLAGARAARRCTVTVRCSSQGSVPVPVQTPTSPAMARRHAVAAVAAAAAALFASPEAVHAAEAAACETSKTTGLTFCETLEGTGNPPVKGSLIRVHYTGRLVSNGAVFDSSYERGRPLTFRVGAGEVIRGWDLGILGSEADGIPPLKEGGKRKLIIPAELGYGSRGAGGVIPPNSSLEFDVELLGKPTARR